MTADSCIEFVEAWREHDVSEDSASLNEGMDTFRLMGKNIIIHAYVSQGMIHMCAYGVHDFIASVKSVLSEIGAAANEAEKYTNPNAFQIWFSQRPEEVPVLD